MSSSLARAVPVANTATAPTQVVSRKLRIGILPATGLLVQRLPTAHLLPINARTEIRHFRLKGQLRTKIHLSSWPRKSHDRSSSLDILSRVAGVPHRFGSVRRAIKNIEMRGYVSNYASSKAPRPAAVESTGQRPHKLTTLPQSIDPSHPP